MSKGTRSQIAAKSVTDSEMEEILKRLESMDSKLDKNVATLNSIDEKVASIETTQTEMKQDIASMKDRIVELESSATTSSETENKLKIAIRKAEIAKIRSEENSRQYNITAYNVAQTDVYEKRDASLKLVRDILSNVLEIPDAVSIVIKNAHRLPSSRGVEPLIFKLNSIYDKDVIWKHIGKLKAFNERQPSNASKIHIDMFNLPPKLQLDKKSLLNRYKELRSEKGTPKAKWFYDKKAGELCIKANGNIIRPPDNFDYKLCDASVSATSSSSVSVMQDY